jgi:hypothetical protein
MVTEYFKGMGAQELRVLLEGPALAHWDKRASGQRPVQREARSPAERRALVEAISLYKSHGFEYCTKPPSDEVPRYLGVRPEDWLVKRLSQGPTQRAIPRQAAE